MPDIEIPKLDFGYENIGGKEYEVKGGTSTEQTPTQKSQEPKPDKARRIVIKAKLTDD